MHYIENFAKETFLYAVHVEDERGAWSADDAPYSKDVEVEHNGFIWKSATDDNSDEPIVGSLKWGYWNTEKNVANPIPYASNINRVFDDTVYTYSESDTGSLEYVFRNNLARTIRLFEFDADTVEIEMRDKDGNPIQIEGADIYSVRAKENPISNLMDWLYMTPIPSIRNLSIDIPIAFTGTLTIRLIGVGNHSKTRIGSIDVGTTKDMGCSIVGATYSWSSGEKPLYDALPDLTYFAKKKTGGAESISAEAMIKGIANFNNMTHSLRQLEGKLTTFVVDERDSFEAIALFSAFKGKLMNFDTKYTSGDNRIYSVSFIRV